MTNSLIILGQLNDHDVEWLIENGINQTKSKGDVLIKQGITIEVIYIILKGDFDIIDDKSGNKLAKVGPGEILGEMSFIDANPPSATVVANEGAVVHAINKIKINEKIKSDLDFAVRFYKAIATLLSDRLRTAISKASGESEKAEDLDLEVLDKVALAGSRFDTIVKRFLTE